MKKVAARHLQATIKIGSKGGKGVFSSEISVRRRKKTERLGASAKVFVRLLRGKEILVSCKNFRTGRTAFKAGFGERIFNTADQITSAIFPQKFLFGV